MSFTNTSQPHDNPDDQVSDIIVEQVFKAPRQIVFDAWTRQEHLVQWWAPEGCRITHCTVDFRVGGTFHWCIEIPPDRQIWARGIYREIAPPERLVYVDSFADARGNRVSPSYYDMSAAHPLESVVTVTFADLGSDTRVVLRHTIPASVPERDDTAEGWSQMFERLAIHLKG